MHQSGLQGPPTASRHVFPTVRSKGPIISDWSQSFSVPRKRNVERACDDCRRRKTRCDGPKMPDNVCTNCVQNRKICTYVEASKPRGPPKAYVTSLEDRVEKMEALLKRVRITCYSNLSCPYRLSSGAWPSFFHIFIEGRTKIKTK
jgi:hypothetical protein